MMYNNCIMENCDVLIQALERFLQEEADDGQRSTQASDSLAAMPADDEQRSALDLLAAMPVDGRQRSALDLLAATAADRRRSAPGSSAATANHRQRSTCDSSAAMPADDRQRSAPAALDLLAATANDRQRSAPVSSAATANDRQRSTPSAPDSSAAMPVDDEQPFGSDWLGAMPGGEIMNQMIPELDPASLINLSQASHGFRAIIKPRREEFVERLLALECTEEYGGAEPFIHRRVWKPPTTCPSTTI
uniref:F-box domain-containing protein n=1 Tax=Bionectria ochroleuca TaxID=29856 RepID=A0A8H7NLR6_BIOOC